MEPTTIFIVKSVILLCVFWSIYHFCLQKETFYQFNRFFLLFGILSALILPLVTMHYTVEITASELPVVSAMPTTKPSIVDPTIEKPTTSYSVSFWLLVTYLTGIISLIVFRIHGLIRLYNAIQQYGYRTYSGYKLVESPMFGSPFSFFQFIFLPRSVIPSKEKDLILEHESAHIAARHWADLLLADLFCISQWFNPIVWFYLKAIRVNHEFQADKAVLQTCNIAHYQTTLVNQWCKTPVFLVTNSFCYSNQLKRIIMMKKNVSNPVKKLLSLLVIPALALFFWAFAEPEYVTVIPSKMKEAVRTSTTPNELSVSSNTLTESKTVTTDQAPPSAKTIKTPETVQPTPIISEKQVSTDTIPQESASPAIQIRGTGDRKPLLIIDGKISDKTMNDINMETIESFNVLKKDDESAKKYGESAKDGVVYIVTKQGKADLLERDGINIKGTVTNEDGKPLPEASVTQYSSIKTLTNKDGNFTLRLLPHSIVTVSKAGYIDQTSFYTKDQPLAVKLKKIVPGITIDENLINNYPKEDRIKMSEFLTITMSQRVKERGVAYLSYTIDTEGNLKDQELTVKNGSEAFKTAIENVLKDFPKVTPPTLQGIPVQMQYNHAVIRIPWTDGPFIR